MMIFLNFYCKQFAVNFAITEYLAYISWQPRKSAIIRNKLNSVAGAQVTW